MSKVENLTLEKFMAFDDKTTLEFSPGINVFIGPNSTGKTVVMKSIYALLKVCEKAHRDQILKESTQLDIAMQEKLQGVFKPDKVGRLTRRGVEQQAAFIEIQYDKQNVRANITSQNEVSFKFHSIPKPAPVVFLPTHEFLFTSEGFLFTYEKRELSFDETYYDLSLALSGPPLKSSNLEVIKSIVSTLEGEIGGKITKEEERFYAELKEGNIEAALLAGGYRKVAELIHLLNNGSLTPKGILFWDEPEANLNPQLISVIIESLQKLAKLGMQVFIATHDYLVSQKLSLLAEYNLENNLKFFAFRQPERGAGVVVESGETLAEIKNNPILDEFADHYDQEMKYFQKTS